MNKLSFFIFALLFIPSLHTFGQVSITPNNDPPHPSAMLDVNSDSLGMIVPRMTKAQRDAIDSPANGLMVYVTTPPKGFFYYNGLEWTTVGSSGMHYIGELFGGGVVFWVDHTGLHGLICSMVDVGTIHWSNVVDAEIGDSAQSTWDGQENSTAIMGQAQHTTSAAKQCDDYENINYGTGVWSNWYCPAIAEIRHLKNNLYDVDKALDDDGDPGTSIISIGRYWSSTEYNADRARVCGVSINETNDASAVKSEPLHVRCVRDF